MAAIFLERQTKREGISAAMSRNILHAPAEGLRHIDAAIERAVAPYRRTAAGRALAQVGKVGDQPPLRAICAGVFVCGLVRGDRRLAAVGVRMLAAHEVATGIKTFLKHRIDRTRPRNAASPADNAARPGNSRAKAESSFPSGHSAGAVAVARAFGRDYPDHRATAVGVAALVGASQVPRSAHFATDVLAGFAVGWAAEAIVNGAFSLARQLLAEVSGVAMADTAEPTAAR
jgi:membrane-associated phospholipid phosphatase